jgi:hypothetical protein
VGANTEGSRVKHQGKCQTFGDIFEAPDQVLPEAYICVLINFLIS